MVKGCLAFLHDQHTTCPLLASPLLSLSTIPAPISFTRHPPHTQTGSPENSSSFRTPASRTNYQADIDSSPSLAGNVPFPASNTPNLLGREGSTPTGLASSLEDCDDGMVDICVLARTLSGDQGVYPPRASSHETFQAQRFLQRGRGTRQLEDGNLRSPDKPPPSCINKSAAARLAKGRKEPVNILNTGHFAAAQPQAFLDNSSTSHLNPTPSGFTCQVRSRNTPTHTPTQAQGPASAPPPSARKAVRPSVRPAIAGAASRGSRKSSRQSDADSAEAAGLEGTTVAESYARVPTSDSVRELIASMKAKHERPSSSGSPADSGPSPATANLLATNAATFSPEQQQMDADAAKLVHDIFAKFSLDVSQLTTADGLSMLMSLATLAGVTCPTQPDELTGRLDTIGNGAGGDVFSLDWPEAVSGRAALKTAILSAAKIGTGMLEGVVMLLLHAESGGVGFPQLYRTALEPGPWPGTLKVHYVMELGTGTLLQNVDARRELVSGNALGSSKAPQKYTENFLVEIRIF